MKRLSIILLISIVIQANAQSYAFSKSIGAYTDLTGSTILANGNWDIFTYGIKMPFSLRYWGDDIATGDSIFVDDYGTISVNYNMDGEMTLLLEDLISRGMDKSPVSYVVEGFTPNRILKIEYRNVGFNLDNSLKDSANFQCWFYETSGIIEYRYGPNEVKSTSWADDGAFVGIANTAFLKFIALESNPANPTLNTTNPSNVKSLQGMPAGGTIYKFTPTGGSGVEKTEVRVNVGENKIYLPASTEVNAIKIYNISGQLLQSVVKTEEVDLPSLGHGLFVLMIETSEGLLSRKLVL